MTDYRRRLLAASPKSAMGGGLIHYVFFKIGSTGQMSNFQIDGENSSFNDFQSLISNISNTDITTEFIPTIVVQVWLTVDNVPFDSSLYTCLIDFNILHINLYCKSRYQSYTSPWSFMISLDLLHNDFHLYVSDSENNPYGNSISLSY